METPENSLSRYLNFNTDFAFKKIFGTESNIDLLISFLNNALGLEGNSAIEKASHIKIDRPGANKEDCDVVYDLYCENGKGENLIVELQKARQEDFNNRLYYFSAFAIQESVKRTNEWPIRFTYAPVYIVSLLDFVQYPSDMEKYIFHAEFMDQDGLTFSNSIRYTFIEIPKFNKTENNLNSLLDKWLFTIKNLHNLQNPPAALTEEIFRKVLEVAEIDSLKKEERISYEDSLKSTL